MAKSRGYLDGNILWQLYKGLGEPYLSEFKEFLKCNGVEFMTFIGDTLKTSELTSIKYARIRVYQSFFNSVNWEEYLPPLEKTPKMREQEEADRLIRKHGMKKAVA